MKSKSLRKTPLAPAASPAPPAGNRRRIEIVRREDEDANLAAAKMFIGPQVTNANSIYCFGHGLAGDALHMQSLVDCLTDSARRINANDMREVEATLANQATTLNMMFAEMARRSANCLNEHAEAAQLFFKMAMKAQNQCRMTLETLANVKNPPVVYARQANISSGPQQVNNGTMPDRAHAVENKNEPNKILEQSSEPRMDAGTQSQGLYGNPPLAAVEAGHRP
jgi:hypothetical protein